MSSSRAVGDAPGTNIINVAQLRVEYGPAVQVIGHYPPVPRHEGVYQRWTLTGISNRGGELVELSPTVETIPTGGLTRVTLDTHGRTHWQPITFTELAGILGHNLGDWLGPPRGRRQACDLQGCTSQRARNSKFRTCRGIRIAILVISRRFDHGLTCMDASSQHPWLRTNLPKST